MVSKLAVLFAVAAAIGAAQAQQPSDLCEESGGEWSDCASACPKTCEQPNGAFFCTSQCVVGCVCPGGTLLEDGVCISPLDCPSETVSVHVEREREREREKKKEREG